MGAHTVVPSTTEAVSRSGEYHSGPVWTMTDGDRALRNDSVFELGRP